MPAGETFSKREAAAALTISPDGFPKLVRTHKLASTGEGKKRRYPRASVEYLWLRANRGLSIQTANYYLVAIKSFVRWMVKDRRIADNPLAHVTGGNVKLDRRHDRRPLSVDELRMLIATAQTSHRTFRALTGSARSVLYAVACVSGYRTAELAELTPSSFDLEADTPTATLPATATKNRRTATQPLSPDVAQMVKGYLAGKPANERLWPGTWYSAAAEMLRIDLETAGIPYVTEGPDGLLYADFHCLRHSQIALLDASGATLKEAMQLARHSDPKLTMARYGRKQIHDLGRAVERLPALRPESELTPLRATGTDG